MQYRVPFARVVGPFLLLGAAMACDSPPGADGAAATSSIPQQPLVSTAPAAEDASVPALGAGRLVDSLAGLCSSETVAAEIRATYPADLASDARAELLHRRRVALRRALREVAWERSLDVERQLLPFVALAEPAAASAALDRASPARCEYLESNLGALWARSVAHRAELARALPLHRETRELFLSGQSGSDGMHGLLLFFAYEAMLLDFLARGGWKSPAFLPPGLPAPDGELPPVYPLNGLTGAMAAPEARLSAIHAHFPVLQRPAEFTLGQPRASLAHVLVREVFGAGTGPSELFARDLAPMWQELNEQHAGQSETELAAFLEERGYALPTEVLPANYSQAQRKYLLAWQRLLNEYLPVFIAARTTGLIENHPERVAQVEPLLAEVSLRWMDELAGARQGLCRADDADVETDPLLLALYLGQERTDTYELLDAYCHGGWGRTPGTIAAAAARLAGYAFIVAGVAFAPPVAVAGLSVNAVASGGGALLGAAHGSELLRRSRAMGLHSALFQPSVTERNWQRAWNVFDAAMVPASVGLWGGVAGQLAARATPVKASYIPFATFFGRTVDQAPAFGWRVFVPAFPTVRQWVYYGIPMMIAAGSLSKKFLELGRNPLTEVSFYTDLLANHVMLMVGLNALGAGAGGSFAQVLLQELTFGTAAGVLAFLAMDDIAQNLRFLATGQVPEGRYRDFTLRFVPTFTTGNMFVLLASAKVIDAMTARATPWIGTFAHAAWKALQAGVYYQLKYSILTRYLVHREMSFLDAVKQLRPSDLEFWVAHDLCAAPPDARMARACAGRDRDLHGERIAADPGAPLVELDSPELAAVQELLRIHDARDPGLDALMQARMQAGADAEAQAPLP
jgi:hypothetical protein